MERAVMGKKTAHLSKKVHSTLFSTINPAYGQHKHAPFAYTSAPAASGGLSAAEAGRRIDDDQLPGYIFMCNGKTKPDCFSYRVFGLPSGRIDVVEKIRLNTILFLYDFDVKLLYGVYVAASCGMLGLEPHAFSGKFPAQVKFDIFKECLPLPEVAFRHAVKENFLTVGGKFKQELNTDQVNKLLSLFCPLFVPPSPAPLAPLKYLATLPSGCKDTVNPLSDFSSSRGHYGGGSQLHHVLPTSSSLVLYDSAKAASGLVTTQPLHANPRYSNSHPADGQLAYHSQDQGTCHYGAYTRYQQMRDSNGRAIISQTVPENDSHSQNTRPQSTISHVKPAITLAVPPHARLHAPPSHQTAAYWAAVAAAATEGDSYLHQPNPPVKPEPGLSYVPLPQYGPAYWTTAAYGTEKLTHATSHQTQQVTSTNGIDNNMPVYATVPHHGTTYHTTAACGPENYGYTSSHQAQQSAVNTVNNNVPIYTTETNPTHSTAAASGYSSQQFVYHQTLQMPPCANLVAENAIMYPPGDASVYWTNVAPNQNPV